MIWVCLWHLRPKQGGGLKSVNTGGGKTGVVLELVSLLYAGVRGEFAYDIGCIVYVGS